MQRRSCIVQISAHLFNAVVPIKSKCGFGGVSGTDNRHPVLKAQNHRKKSSLSQSSSPSHGHYPGGRRTTLRRALEPNSKMTPVIEAQKRGVGKGVWITQHICLEMIPILC